jgi:hypothetical protein
VLESVGNGMSFPLYAIKSAAAAIDLGSYHRLNGKRKLLKIDKFDIFIIKKESFAYLSLMNANAA